MFHLVLVLFAPCNPFLAPSVRLTNSSFQVVYASTNTFKGMNGVDDPIYPSQGSKPSKRRFWVVGPIKAPIYQVFDLELNCFRW